MPRYLTFEQKLLKNTKRKNLLIFLFVFLVFNYIITLFFIKFFILRSENLEPTIATHSYLLFHSRSIALFNRDLVFGDVVIYKSRQYNNLLLDFLKSFFLFDRFSFIPNNLKVSRIVALKGDIVYVKNFDVLVRASRTGVYYLNGIIIPNYQINDFFYTKEVIKIYVIKEHEFFLLNDNLNIIDDSRVFGPVDENIIFYLLIFRLLYGFKIW